MITFKFVEEDFFAESNFNNLKILIDRLKSKGDLNAYNLSIELSKF